ncbi:MULTISPECIES: hypothetical protein [unclassified Variovorax]|uniref:hypothetical protein n=1 Tax=unclassified Variovorax TaxID=663243 RepID=UPI003F48DE50
MGNAIDLAARSLWLTLRDDGGWWSVSSLTHHWRPVFADFEVRDHLERLHRLGFLERRPLDPRAPAQMTYAVTSSCQALPGYQLAPQRRTTA